MTRRLPRCSHGLPAQLCVVPTCPHWDRKSDAAATYTDSPARRKRRRDRARERYDQKRGRQEQIAAELVEAKETAS